MAAHDCKTFTAGCFRCGLNIDELWDHGVWVCPQCRRGNHADGYGHEPMRDGDTPLCGCPCLNVADPASRDPRPVEFMARYLDPADDVYDAR